MAYISRTNSIPYAFTGTATGTKIVGEDITRRHVAIYAKDGTIEIAFGDGITFDDVSLEIQQGVMWEPRFPNTGPIWLKGDGLKAVVYLDGQGDVAP